MMLLSCLSLIIPLVHSLPTSFIELSRSKRNQPELQQLQQQMEGVFQNRDISSDQMNLINQKMAQITSIA